MLIPRHTRPSVTSGPAIPGPNQRRLRSNPRHLRDVLAALWPPNVVSAIVVYEFLVLTDIMDPTDREILGWVEIDIQSFKIHLCYCLYFSFCVCVCYCL